MGGEAHGQAGVLEAALHHAADVHYVQGVLRELPGLLEGSRKEGSVLTGAAETGRIEVFKNGLLQIAEDGDLTALAALLVEVQHSLIAGVIETPALERGQYLPRARSTLRQVT